MIRSNELNPYSPQDWTLEEQDTKSQHAGDRSPSEPPTIGRLIFRWTVVCGFAAAPSLVLGYLVSPHQFAAMLLGIGCFIALYIYVDRMTENWAWRKTTIIRRLLVFCYGCRIAISIIYPLGVTIDMLAGLVSMAIVGADFTPRRDTDVVPEEPMSFLLTFVLTIIQGTLLNVILAAWGLLSFLVVRAYQFVASPVSATPENN
jgi:hypothetical protein